MVAHVCTTALRELTSEDGELTANTDHIGRKDQRLRGEITATFPILHSLTLKSTPDL